MIVVIPRQPAPAPRPRVPLACDPDARAVDITAAARMLGCRLVTDGEHIYLTPRVLPGEFPVAEAA
jgi:hypothetical protein